MRKTYIKDVKRDKDLKRTHVASVYFFKMSGNIGNIFSIEIEGIMLM